MTDEERRNRNPAGEISRFDPAAHPVVTAGELEMHRVYILHSAKSVVTLNYMGLRHGLHPVSLDVIDVHHFHGPRDDLDIFITVRADGSFEDAFGARLTIRRWTGEDA